MIEVTNKERFVVFSAMTSTPWSGPEVELIARGEIYELLELRDFEPFVRTNSQGQTFTQGVPGTLLNDVVLAAMMTVPQMEFLRAFLPPAAPAPQYGPTKASLLRRLKQSCEAGGGA